MVDLVDKYSGVEGIVIPLLVEEGKLVRNCGDFEDAQYILPYRFSPVYSYRELLDSIWTPAHKSYETLADYASFALEEIGSFLEMWREVRDSHTYLTEIFDLQLLDEKIYLDNHAPYFDQTESAWRDLRAHFSMLIYPWIMKQYSPN
ncbi:MAG: hypothetical protein O2779_03060 [Nanoarchaeota archaeon]|nr:hypothetical protein [Nanoarchaeota archaeon]